MPQAHLPPVRQILQMPALWIGISLSFLLAVYVAHWESAVLHDTTALKAGVEDLLLRGEHLVPLVERIRQLMRAYDMDAIARLLSALPVEDVACAG